MIWVSLTIFLGGINMKKVRMHVNGRVQGVGFRFLTKMAADRLGIKGIVRNEPDGSVYIEAMGSEEILKDFISLIKGSPSPSGRVDECDIVYDDAIKERTSFDVTY